MKIPLKTNCKICGSRKFFVWGRKNGQNLYKCEYCKVVFFLPYPVQEELDRYYANLYHAERNYDGGGITGKLRKEMYDKDIEDLMHEVPEGGRILDVGCAEGVFLSKLGDMWDKYGIDCSKYAVDRANDKDGIHAEVSDLSGLPDELFDVIHLRGVFEHLLEPMTFCIEANRKIKPEGILVLSNTPNADGIVPKLFRGRFKLVIPMEHIHYFTPCTLNILADRAGYQILTLKYPYWRTPYCSFWKNLLSIPINYLLGKESPPFYGNIFTAYFKKVKDV